MPRLLRMPEVAAGAAEAVLAEWLVAERAEFAAADTLATVETDKAMVNVEADDAGVLLSTLVAPGAHVEVGAPIAVLGQPGEVVPDIGAVLADLGVAAPAARRVGHPSSRFGPISHFSPASFCLVGRSGPRSRFPRSRRAGRRGRQRPGLRQPAGAQDRPAVWGGRRDHHRDRPRRAHPAPRRRGGHRRAGALPHHPLRHHRPPRRRPLPRRPGPRRRAGAATSRTAASAAPSPPG